MRRPAFSILSGMGTGLTAEFWLDVKCKPFHVRHRIGAFVAMNRSFE